MDEFSTLSGTALVAGGTGGIGAAIVTMLAERGSRVMFTYRTNRARAEALAASASASAGRPTAGALATGGPAAAGADDHAPRVQAMALDLADAAGVADALRSVAEESGGLHTVVYAAGPHVPMVHLSRVAPHQLNEQLAQDASAFFALAHAALPHLRDACGSIVAVTTAATSRHPVRDGLSTVPKAAVEAIARGLAVEEGRYGVRVNCVGPGMLTDGMATRLIDSGELGPDALDAARAAIPLRAFGTADDVAETVCFLASPRAAFITGQKINVDGGYSN